MASTPLICSSMLNMWNNCPGVPEEGESKEEMENQSESKSKYALENSEKSSRGNAEFFRVSYHSGPSCSSSSSSSHSSVEKKERKVEERKVEENRTETKALVIGKFNQIVTLEPVQHLYLASKHLGVFRIEAEELFERSKSSKYPTAKKELEKLLVNPIILDPKLTLVFLKAMNNTAEGQYELGMAYFRGFCCARCLGIRVNEDLDTKSNYKEAVRWLKLAAQQEHARAQLILAKCHFKGWGELLPNKLKAGLLFKKALTNASGSGDGEVFYLLAEQYYRGDCLPQNKTQAVALLHQSIMMGNEKGYALLGKCYLLGEGCLRDGEKAFENLSKVKADDDLGNFYLASCYAQGTGCKPDPKKAFQMFKKISERGNYLKARIAASKALANCYENGKGCGKNLKQAYRWYKRANSPADAERVGDLINGRCVIL